MPVLKYSCTALVGTNKIGELTPDADGYYEVIIGGLGMLNSSGQFYDADATRQLFEQDSSALQRRIKRGVLRGEVGHPVKEPTMTMNQYIQRIMEIRETNTCCHFSEVWIDTNRVKTADGMSCMAIMAKMKPSGAKGEFLEKQMQNKKENVCFSIRGFTEDITLRGKIIRFLRTVITFDYVNEPGIAIAEKYKSPSLENYGEDSVFTTEQLTSSIQDMTTNNLATESSTLIANELLDIMGIELKGPARPIYTKW